MTFLLIGAISGMFLFDWGSECFCVYDLLIWIPVDSITILVRIVKIKFLLNWLSKTLLLCNNSFSRPPLPSSGRGAKHECWAVSFHSLKLACIVTFIISAFMSHTPLLNGPVSAELERNTQVSWSMSLPSGFHVRKCLIGACWPRQSSVRNTLVDA